MSKDPAVLFYTSDFLSGTFTMTNEQVGMYIRLLCLQHQKGSRLTEQDMIHVCTTYVDLVFDKFVKDEDGRYYNERMEEETLRRKKFCESRRASRMSHVRQTCVERTETATETGIEAVTEKKQPIKPSFDFEAIWKKYPSNGRVGKKKSLTHFVASVLNEQDYADIQKALDNYIVCKRVKEGFIQNATTWFNNWRDWIEYRERKPIDDIPESIRKYFDEDGRPIK